MESNDQKIQNYLPLAGWMVLKIDFANFKAAKQQLDGRG
jgi:hypothetical protein